MFSADLGGITASSTPASNDPPFQKVALLLHGDGTNGAQNNTFLDSSTNNFTITRTGNVAQGTFSPFSVAEGQWSNYFDGSGDYLSLATSSSLDVAQNTDFTVECWFYSEAVVNSSTFQLIVCQNSSTFLNWSIRQEGTSLQAIIGNATVASTMLANQWVHVALVQQSNTAYLYVNGTLAQSKAITVWNNLSLSTTIGSGAGGWRGFKGSISNVRIVKGTAVYTANFTPPTSALTAITNTSLLTCQSNRFKDNSSNNFTLTRNGDTKVTAFSPFAPSAAYDASTNGGSGYFDGSGDYLSLPNNAALSPESGDFTIEAWLYLSALPSTYSHIYCSNPTNGVTTYVSSTGIVSIGYANALIIADSSTAISTNTWNHVAFTRSGTTVRIFINGVQKASVTNSTAFTSTVVGTIGFVSPFNYFNGYISNLRVVKGTAVYTANFTPPTSPLTAITNTQLLLNCTNAGIIDNAGKNDIETVGNAQVSTSVKKYGTGSMYFDGTGDWLYLADRPELQLGTGNFTVEGWLYLGATGAARGIVGKGTSTAGWLLSTNSSNQVVFTYGSSTITSTGTLSGSTWYHIAVCREGTGTNQTKIYINGSNDGTGTVNINFNQTNVMYVGANRTGGDAMNGYIDDLRITQGQALYTSNFTPPTQAFSNV